METTSVITPESLTLKDAKKAKKSDPKSKKEKKKEGGKKGGEGKQAKDYKQPTDEENEERRRKYEGVIAKFVASEEDRLEFPPNLNSFERRLIHQICEAEGLVHESIGEEKERRIVVRKSGKADDEQEDGKTEGENGTKRRTIEEGEVEDKGEEQKDQEEEGEENEAEEETENQISEDEEEQEEENEKKELGKKKGKSEKLNLKNEKKGKKKERKQQKEKKDPTESENNKEKSEIIIKDKKEQTKEPLKTGAIPKIRMAFINGEYKEVPVVKVNNDETLRCNCCGKDIPRHNFCIHNAQCQRKMRAKQEAAEKKKEDEKNKPKTNETKAPKISKKKKSEDEREDFDAVIAQFTKENNTCFQPKCKTATSLIFQLCPFCRKTYCLTHHMAEVHGCGDEARRHAREMVIKEGKIYPGSGIPSKKPNEMKRKHLKKNLDKKLNDMTNQRQKKGDKDKDKGKHK